MASGWVPAALVALMLSAPGPVPAARAADPDDPGGTWVPLEDPPGGMGQVRDFAMDRASRLWLVSATGLHRRDRGAWTSVVTGPSNDTSRFRFVGGPDRGLYLAQPGPDEHTGLLWSLDGSDPVRVGEFYIEGKDPGSGLIVASSGSLLNVTTRYLGVWRDGAWKGGEVSLGSAEYISIVDFGPAEPVLLVPGLGGTGILVDESGARTEVNVPPLPGPGETRSLACALGNGDLLLFGGGQQDAAIIHRNGGTLEPVPWASGELLLALGKTGMIRDAWPAGRGGAWVVVTNAPGCEGQATLFHLSAKGALVRPRFPGDAKPYVEIIPFRRNPRRTVTGSVDWIASNGDGLLRLAGTRFEIHGASRGVPQEDIRWLAGRAEGPLYAATPAAGLLRWDPTAVPDAATAERWSCVPLDMKPLVDPRGRMWMIRKDRPGRIDLWEGRAWTEVPIPDGRRVRNLVAADEAGGLVVDLGGRESRWCVLAGGTTGLFATLHEALASRIAAGATRFRTSPYCTFVVDGKGRGFGVIPSENRVFVGSGSSWDVLTGQDKREVLLSDDGATPLFSSADRWWIWKEGRFEALPVPAVSPDNGRGPRIVRDKIYAGFPFALGLPRDLRETAVLMTVDGYALPVPWEEADRAARAGTAPTPPPLRDLGLRGLPPKGSDPMYHNRFPGELDALDPAVWLINPEAVLTDGEGGAWISSSTGFTRLRGDAAFSVSTEGTPIHGRRLADVEIDASGRPWFLVQRGEDFLAWFDRGGGPTLGGLRTEVVQGRRVELRGAGPDARFLEIRESSGGPWRLEKVDPAPAWCAKTAGRGSVALEVRGYDALGVAGPAVRVEASFDARFPSLRWAGGAAPRAVTEPRWKVPVEVESPFPELPRRIETRVEGGPWSPLAADGTLLVVAWNNRGVRIDVRVVEDERFSSPALAAEIAVEADLGPWIEERIDRALTGDETAFADLLLVREAGIAAAKRRTGQAALNLQNRLASPNRRYRGPR